MMMQAAPTWDSRLDDATTELAVADVCDRFVSGWSFQDLGQLPAACQPARVVEARHVSPYAEILVARLGASDSAAAPMLHRMSAFFTKAAQRMAQIATLEAEAPALDGTARSPCPYV